MQMKLVGISITGKGEIALSLEKKVSPAVVSQIKRVLPTPPKGCAVPKYVQEKNCWKITFPEFSEVVQSWVRSLSFDIGEWTGETVRDMDATFRDIRLIYDPS